MKKQQILVIHGGNTFKSYEDYLSQLKTYPIELEEAESHTKWKQTLGERLGDNFAVYRPQMPNSSNANYEEWRIWFERYFKLLDDNPILIGHSLGGIFLAKYFSENESKKPIKAALLLAAPVGNTPQEAIGTFDLPKSLDRLSSQINIIHLLHSQDDDTVPYEQVNRYQKLLPSAKLTTFTDKGHFRDEEFPEIIKLIRDIANSHPEHSEGSIKDSSPTAQNDKQANEN